MVTQSAMDLQTHKPVHIIRQGAIYFLVFAIGAPLIFLLLGLHLDRLLGIQLPFNILVSVLGMLTISTGAGLLGSATRVLAQHGKGLPLSSAPPQKLVTNGAYAFSRHPVYLGGCLLFFGISVLVHSFWGATFGTLLLFCFYFSYARGIEEPVLEDRYGDDYRKYRQSVPLVAPLPFATTLEKASTELLKLVSTIINKPRMFRSGNYIIFWGYGLWPGLGVMLGLALMELILLSEGISPAITAGLIAALTILCLGGVRAAWLLVTVVRERNGFQTPRQKVGFMSWGVLLGMVLVATGFTRFTGNSVTLLLDAAFSGLLLAHFLGRIGCMFYGCCYGKQAEMYGLRYHHHALKAVREHGEEQHLIPVQLLSALYGLAGAFFVVGLWYAVGLSPGLPAAIAMVWYGSFRIAEEWLRRQRAIWHSFIAPSQIPALLLVLIGLAIIMLADSTADSTYQLSFSFLITDMHPLLLLASGVVTTLLFSYHHEEVGRWS